MKASLSITNSRSLLRLMPIESVMPSSHLILCRPLLLLSPIPPSIRVFSNESTLCIRWPKYWSFSFSISPSNEHPGLISFRMDWLDVLARDSQKKKKKSSVICTYGPIILRVNMVPSLFKKKFFIWLCQVLAAACDMNLVPWTVVRPDLLHWECRVLATGPLGKSYLLRFY